MSNFKASPQYPEHRRYSVLSILEPVPRTSHTIFTLSQRPSVLRLPCPASSSHSALAFPLMSSSLFNPNCDGIRYPAVTSKHTERQHEGPDQWNFQQMRKSCHPSVAGSRSSFVRFTRTSRFSSLVRPVLYPPFHQPKSHLCRFWTGSLLVSCPRITVHYTKGSSQMPDF